LVFALACLVAAPMVPSPALAQCGPTLCPGSSVFLSFEPLSPGTTVEGLGAVHPDLNITSVAWPFGPTCTPGVAAAIEEGVFTPFAAYGTAGSFANGCLDGIRGFGDPQGCVLDYDFTFAPGVSVSCFSFRMLDFGDLFPFGGTTHTVTVEAYNAANVLVANDVLTMLGGVDLVTGDACTSQGTDPGNRLFTVTGPGITRVTLRFDAFPDPNCGFDDISFCEEALPTPTLKRSWGAIKSHYRD
ncbi:MAG: hypothetical protein ABL977_12460, partial [Candidatus Eisenbacteria bacterium]